MGIIQYFVLGIAHRKSVETYSPVETKEGLEDANTIGTKANQKITENAIRKEHGLEKRVSYETK